MAKKSSKKKASPKIKFSDSFETQALDGNGGRFRWSPDGIYFYSSPDIVELQYSGARASDSYSGIQLPADPKFLRRLAKRLEKVPEFIE